MGSLFSKPAAPVVIPPAAPTPPTPMPDPASENLLEASRQKIAAQQQGGRTATLLSAANNGPTGASGAYTGSKLGGG